MGIYISYTSDRRKWAQHAVHGANRHRRRDFTPSSAASGAQHVALSLARLNGLVESELVRIGMSATQRPIERVAEFLVG